MTGRSLMLCRIYCRGFFYQRMNGLLTRYPVLPVPGLNTTPAHRCVGMSIDELSFVLWEGDVQGPSGSSLNQVHIRISTARLGWI